MNDSEGYFDDTVTTIESGKKMIDQLRQLINAHLVGQSEVVDQIIVALLCNGHVLVEGVPGLGKTLLVRTLANCFKR